MNDRQRLRLEYLYRIAHGISGFIFCDDCGESDLRKLTGGHRENDGATHREALLPGVLREARSAHFPRKLREMGWPVEHMRRLRIECYSCNNAKRSVLRSLTDKDMREYLFELDQRQEARPVPTDWEIDPERGLAAGGDSAGRPDSAAGGAVRDRDGDPAAGNGGVL